MDMSELYYYELYLLKVGESHAKFVYCLTKVETTVPLFVVAQQITNANYTGAAME